MLKIKILILITYLTAFFVGYSNITYANDAPSFPSCTNPSGNLKVSYDNGNHAIVGQTALRGGSDKVYSVGNSNYVQCFCPPTGSGIQTNWWKAGQLSEDEVESLKKLGWYFIPDGTAWGLESGVYMAKNESYSCNGGNTITSGESGGVSQILGLAETSGKNPAFLFTFLGIASILLGLWIGVFSKSRS